MTKLHEHIEEMRSRLHEIADGEQTLLNALGEALARLDQQLLRDVRSIATEHEVRREAILGELQGLAAGIGMFRAPLSAAPAREELPRYMPDHGHMPAQGHRPAQGHSQAIAPGDWRQAASNIEDDLDYAGNGGGSSH